MVLFKQKRPGKHEKPFVLLKFQTLRPMSEAFISHHQRVTKFGNFLRKTSLDELPQLINVLKGEMSLIGPRPLLMEYLPLYNDFQKKRHSVLPGITGLAQVKGRNALSWEEKFKFDVHYVENLHWKLDFKIGIMSFLAIFSQRGIYDTNGQIVENFKGN
jgi:sugar transferase EpsL